MRTLVTGGVGFIGGWVVRRLVEMDWPVVSLDVQQSETLPTAAAQVTGDVGDLAAVLQAIKQHRIEAVVHTAGLFTAACSAAPMLAYRVNVGGTVNVLEAARLLEVQRVVFTSSVNVYGPGRFAPVSEDHPLDLVSLYAATKAACEGFGRTYASSFGLNVTALRATSIYGPGKARGSTVISRLIGDAHAGRPLVAEVGGQPLNVLYVEDLVRAAELALTAAPPGYRVYNIGSGRTITVETVAEILRRHFPHLPVQITPGANNTGFPLTLPLNTAAAGRELGWEPQFDLEAGISRCLALLGGQRKA